MNRDDIIRMARNCFDVHTDSKGRETFSGDHFCVEELVALVTKAEREACAKVCASFVAAEYGTGKVDHNERAWTDHCAAAILARGQNEHR